MTYLILQEKVDTFLAFAVTQLAKPAADTTFILLYQSCNGSCAGTLEGPHQNNYLTTQLPNHKRTTCFPVNRLTVYLQLT